MTIGTATVVRRRGQAVFSRLDDELLALDPEAGCCYSLNGPAARVWELIDPPIAIGDVCDRLEEEYEVAPATCVADVIELIGELRAAGLIDIADEPA